MRIIRVVNCGSCPHHIRGVSRRICVERPNEIIGEAEGGVPGVVPP